LYLADGNPLLPCKIVGILNRNDVLAFQSNRTRYHTCSIESDPSTCCRGGSDAHKAAARSVKRACCHWQPHFSAVCCCLLRNRLWRTPTNGLRSSSATRPDRQPHEPPTPEKLTALIASQLELGPFRERPSFALREERGRYWTCLAHPILRMGTNRIAGGGIG
jgi:hypothetical protein